MRRKMPNEYPPFFDETICCLALILGKSCDSGCNSGLDAEAKLAVISANPERFSGERLWESQIRDQGG